MSDTIKPKELESYRQEAIYHGKQGVLDDGLRTTPIPSPQGELVIKGQMARSDRPHISQADRDQARQSTSSKAPTVAEDHVARVRIELTNSKDLEI